MGGNRKFKNTKEEDDTSSSEDDSFVQETPKDSDKGENFLESKNSEDSQNKNLNSNSRCLVTRSNKRYVKPNIYEPNKQNVTQTTPEIISGDIESNKDKNSNLNGKLESVESGRIHTNNLKPDSSISNSQIAELIELSKQLKFIQQKEGRR